MTEEKYKIPYYITPMRITTTARNFFLLLLGIIALSVLILWLIFHHPHIATILGACLLGIVGLFVLYVSFAPLFNYLSERASSIEAVYEDVSGKGIHIFSSFNVSRYKVGLSALRTIQYYFLDITKKKLYYKVIKTHDTRAAAGKAGYTDEFDFEKDVLQGNLLKTTMAVFAQKAGWPLQLGKVIQEDTNEKYETKIAGHTIRIESKEGLVTDGMRVCCYEESGRLLWTRKI